MLKSPTIIILRQIMELSTNILAVKQSSTMQTAQIKIMKKQNEMQQVMIDMIAQAARSAPPSGQGTIIDKTA